MKKGGGGEVRKAQLFSHFGARDESPINCNKKQGTMKWACTREEFSGAGM